MINLRLQARRAVARDQRQISSLLLQESNTHRHLDWRNALEWLGVRNYWALEDQGLIVSALACPEDPHDVAWIRIFTHHTHLTGPEAWSALWSIAQAEIFHSNPRARVAAIVMKQWFQSLLLGSGFEPLVEIVLLELKSENYVAPRLNTDVRIRPMQPSDMPEVEGLDRAAFGAFWHNTQDSLFRAYEQSYCATVAEDQDGLAGYQLSTGNPFGVHLARLGVKPDAQGRGVGSSLTHDLIQRTGVFRSGRLSVNTQADNLASLHMYKKLGFAPTGVRYPVLTASVDTAR